jgi:hypothetical protein
MSEDKKPAPPRAPVAPPPAEKPLATGAPVLSESIPVALVRFDRFVQYPGKQQDEMAKTERASTGHSWKVDYLPAMEMFRIDYFDAVKKTTTVGYIPVCRATCWWPA